MRRSSGHEKHSPWGQGGELGSTSPFPKSSPCRGLSPSPPLLRREGKQFSGNAKVRFFRCFSLLALLPEEAGPHVCSSFKSPKAILGHLEKLTSTCEAILPICGLFT